jgi:hypothetical protein
VTIVLGVEHVTDCPLDIEFRGQGEEFCPPRELLVAQQNEAGIGETTEFFVLVLHRETKRISSFDSVGAGA